MKYDKFALSAIEGLPRDRITQSVFSDFIGVNGSALSKIIIIW